MSLEANQVIPILPLPFKPAPTPNFILLQRVASDTKKTKINDDGKVNATPETKDEFLELGETDE
jgi:hypothetical protein